MQPANLRTSFGVTYVAIYVLFAAVYLVSFAFIVLNLTPLLVPLFLAVSALGLTITLTLGWALAKLKAYREHVAVLTRAVIAAHTTNALLTRTLTATGETCETTQDELDDALEKVTASGHKNARLEKDLRWSTATISHLRQHLTESNGKLRATETKLHKETAKHGGKMHEVVALGKRLAAADSKHHAMADELVVMKQRLNDVVKGTRKKVIAQEAKANNLTKRLASATTDGDAAQAELAATSKKLTEQTATTAVLSQRVEDITAERDAAKIDLHAANEEVATRDAEIAYQRLEIGEGRQLVVDRGHANLVLDRMLTKTQTQLKDALFHLEVQQLSGKAVKAKAARSQEEVKNLQRLTLSLQLPASTSAHGDDAALGTKNDAAAATQDGGSSGTVSTALSPSDTGGSNVSRSGSSGNMSNSGDGGIALPVVPPRPQAEGSPAAVHTGAHNRPKRVKRSKRGQQNRSSAKKVNKMVAGLSRGVDGVEKMPKRN